MVSRIQQIILVLIVLAILSQAKYCLATDQVSEETLREYKEEAQELAKNFSSSKIAPIFDNELDSSKSSGLKNSMPFYQGENVANAGIDIEHASDQGVVKRKAGKDASKSQCNANNCELGNIFSSSAMEDRQVRMEEAGFIKDAEGNIIDNKGYLDKAKKISKNAAANFDFLKGEYKNCKAEDSYTTSKTVESCDQYYDVVHNNCPVNQVVEIDPRYFYQCHKKREVKEKVCNEYVTSKCETTVPCAFAGEKEGGLYTSSSNSEFMSASGGKFHWEYDGETLFFGDTTHFSYECCKERHSRGMKRHYCNDCCTRNFTAKFYIKDVGNVSKFEIVQVFENNIMDIWVNGHKVYEGAKHAIKTVPSKSDICWYNNGHKHWSSYYYDLKGVIKEGWNQVEINLRYTDRGHAGLRIKAKQYCCNSWNDKSEVKCKYVN